MIKSEVEQKQMADVKLDPKKPILQPAGFDPNDPIHRFETDEILWWDNGTWGKAGYAISNDGGKTTTKNNVIYAIHGFIGRGLFELMHRDDVKMSRPFNADWLFELNKMLTLGIKRMGDQAVGWTDERTGDGKHAKNTPRTWTVFPVPFFGGRIRQADAKKWCSEVLLLLSEIMQHSDNEYDNDITDQLASLVQKKLKRIQADMAMKYLGITREETASTTFVVPSTAFSSGNYNPDDLFTSFEMTEERMPNLWWPKSNDLTPIAGISSTVANVFAKRWPIADGFHGDAADEAAWPNGGIGIVKTPGGRP